MWNWVRNNLKTWPGPCCWEVTAGWFENHWICVTVLPLFSYLLSWFFSGRLETCAASSALHLVASSETSIQPARGSLLLSPGCAVIPPIRIYCRCCEAAWNLFMSLLLLSDHRFSAWSSLITWATAGDPLVIFFLYNATCPCSWYPPVKKGTSVSCLAVAVACLDVSEELCHVILCCISHSHYFTKKTDDFKSLTSSNIFWCLQLTHLQNLHHLHAKFMINLKLVSMSLKFSCI